MSVIVSEYNLVRIYLAGAAPLQVYFAKADAPFADRLEQIAAEKYSGNTSLAAREILQRALKTTKAKLADKIQKECEKQDKKVSGFVREILIEELGKQARRR